MNIQDIIRAWRDKEFRQSLSQEQLIQLPENPIGETLSQEELRSVSGGRDKVNDTEFGNNCYTVVRGCEFTDDAEACQ